MTCPVVEEPEDSPPSATSSAVLETSAEAAESPELIERRHDPERIRGEALRKSLFFCTLGWVFGAFWFTAAANGGVPTRLGEYLVPKDAKDMIFGLMGAMPFIGVLFMVPGSWHINRTGRRKGIFLWWLTIMRIMYLPVALLPWIVPEHHRGSAYLFVTFLFIAWAAGQYGGQAWTSWMADLVPTRVRGKYFARRSRMGILVMACTAIGLGLLLDYSDTLHFKTLMEPVRQFTGLPPLIAVISVIFFLAALAGITDIQVFHKVHEPPMRAKVDLHPVTMFRAPLRDRRFMRFVAYLTCVTCADAILGSFVWVYLLDMLDNMQKANKAALAAGPGAMLPHPRWLTDHRVLGAYILLQISVNAGSFLGLPLWGRIIDRLGRKPVIFWGSFLHTLTLFFWVLASPGLLLYGLIIQLFAGAVVSGRDTANFNMMLTYNRAGGPAYQTVASVFTAIAGATSAIVFGRLAQYMNGVTWTVFAESSWQHTFNHYNVLFAVTVLLRILADFILLPRVADGAAVSRRVALRHIIGDVYGNLNAVVLTPLRNFELPPFPSMAALPVRLPFGRLRGK